MPTSPPATLPVTLDDVVQARDRIAGALIRTPCVRSGYFSERLGGAYFKLDNLQRTSSFKERGALNRMLMLSPEERRRGVIAASAGNHAQGVAYHAGRLGIGAKIVMPVTTPEVKQLNTRQFGAQVVIHGANYDEAMALALELGEREGRVLIHPFDDAYVIAGQGTLGLELVEDLEAGLIAMDTVVVPIGGGGLIAGIAVAVKALRPEVRVIGVESRSRDAAARSREAGERVSLEPEQMRRETIADGIAVQRIGELTHPLIEAYVDDIVTVDEAEIASAVFLLLERQKTLVEGACAATVAAMLNPELRRRIGGSEVVMLLSGGNIDVNLLSRIVERGMTRDGRLSHLRVALPDRPGMLSGLSQLLGEQGANILQLSQRHGIGNLWVTEVEVDLTLETRGAEHRDAVKRALAEAGYVLKDANARDPWRPDAAQG